MMRDVRQIGRRTWLARASGGAIAVWTSLTLGGCSSWAVSLGAPAKPSGTSGSAGAGGSGDIRRVPLGANGFTTSYIIIRGKEAAIVDTGVGGSGPRIGEVVKEAGLGWDAVQHLILTHHHADHAGSVGAVLNAAEKAKVWAGAQDIASIPSPRTIAPAEDGAEIFGLRVIATPGHTLGHISVYDQTTSTLITGDALSNVGGTLTGSPRQFTADTTKATESVRKIAGLSFERAFFMHGDPIDKGASAVIGKLALALPNDAAMLARLSVLEAACCHA